jgi:hypothetical protein
METAELMVQLPQKGTSVAKTKKWDFPTAAVAGRLGSLMGPWSPMRARIAQGGEQVTALRAVIRRKRRGNGELERWRDGGRAIQVTNQHPNHLSVSGNVIVCPLFLTMGDPYVKNSQGKGKRITW